MRCISTRGGDSTSLSSAIAQGLASDGGLYVPTLTPLAVRPRNPTLVASAQALLTPYFVDEALPVSELVERAFTFDAPTRWLTPATGLLELFHGPTAAFKDFGARFLAECLMAQHHDGLLTVLVATSGDTGAAVAAAFHGRPSTRVFILYPDGGVSPRQAHQLGAFGGNVTALRVQGTFDDCQRMVKAAFSDEKLRTLRLTSANSVSLGRLLPQAAYFAAAAWQAQARDIQRLNFVVPTGNLGNALACLIAKRQGAPIGQVVLATNANRTLVDLVEQGTYSPRPSVATLANAMDVGAPSNVERLLHWYPSVRGIVEADAVNDDAIRACIVRTEREHGVVVCPHTACALEVLNRLRPNHVEDGAWVVAATAHPAKFDAVVEPLVGHTVTVPDSLAAILERPSRAQPLQPTAEALRVVLLH